MARQAGGAALVQFGESVVLVTATALTTAREGIDFFPLTCDYQEKTFAAGKIPGGFFKREGRPAEKEILTSRLIDRPLRPLFPKGFNCETQVIATVLSHDRESDPYVLALLGASTALVLSDIPWNGPIAAVRIGRVGGRFVINPTTSQLASSDMNVIVAGSRDAIVMVEGGAHMVPEAVLLEALFTAHEALQPLIALQEGLQRLVGKAKRSVTPPAVDPELERQVREAALPSLRAALARSGKQERYDALDQARDEVVARLGAGTPERAKQVAGIFDHMKKDVVREAIVQQKRRLDGRGLADVRPITCEVEVLPRTHGSALFTRGETQALVVATLGTSSDEQKIDALIGEQYKKFMMHYNFPPFSTGEVKFLRGPGRREIGHGALAAAARRALHARAAHRHHPHQAGPHPRPDRPGRQGDPRHHRGDRGQDRRGGRRHGAGRVLRRRRDAEGARQDPRRHRRGGGGQDLPGHGAQDRRLRRLRGDLPGHGRPGTHLAARRRAGAQGLRRAQGGRRHLGQGARGGQVGKDQALPKGSAQGGGAARGAAVGACRRRGSPTACGCCPSPCPT